jgi:MFS transporter, DHA1 family, purine base/nucleoside efflux pump
MQLSGKVCLMVGWITLCLMGTELFVISPLLPFISEEYKVTSAETGWMVTVFAVTYAVAAPFFGWLSDKKGRKNLIASGLLLFAFANALTAAAPSFTWLIVSRIIAGMSVASITPLIYAIIGDLAPQNRRGSWLSIVVSGHLTALWAGAPFGILIEHLWGWRSVFALLAGLGGVLAVVNFNIWGRVSVSLTIRKNVSPGNLLRILRSVSVTTGWAIPGAPVCLQRSGGCEFYS